MMVPRMRILMTVTLVLAWAGWAAAEAQTEAKPGIEPRADKILRQMSDYLAQAREFGFAFEESIDEVSGSGFKIRYSNQRKVVLRRPARLVAEGRGDLVNRSAWYDGKKMTLLDRRHNVYAQIDAPPSIDATIEHLVSRFDVVLPLADLIYSNPYQEVIGQVVSGFYAGMHQAGSFKCHHLAFRQEFVDWQIWIDAGPKPIPRKLLITYKLEEGQPQYQALITDWKEPLQMPDEAFLFKPPSGAQRVEMTEMLPETVPDK